MQWRERRNEFARDAWPAMADFHLPGTRLKDRHGRRSIASTDDQ